jgi:hypothetical protein
MSSLACSSRADEVCVEFYVGNPQVSITPGTLRLYKKTLALPQTTQVFAFQTAVVFACPHIFGAGCSGVSAVLPAPT